MSLAKINIERASFTDIKHRKNIRNLTVQELNDYRKALNLSFSISDERGYQYWAGIHGLPLPRDCQSAHHTDLFLPWHRAYLYLFEKTLQDFVPGVTIPYWDWSSATSIKEGIPKAFTDETYVDDAGVKKSNPLFSARIAFLARNTNRAAGRPADLASRAAKVTDAKRQNSFRPMSGTLESGHDGLHGWIGGDMGVIDRAAFDPIFWSHHCFVDKVWSDWQHAHPGAVMPDLQSALAPFSITVEQTIQHSHMMGYDYIASEAMGVSPEKGLFNLSVNMLTEDINRQLIELKLDDLDQDVTEASLEFHYVHPPILSYEVRVFFNTANASEKTKTTGNPLYAGSLFMFGKQEECAGDIGHCDPPKGREKFDLRKQEHTAPYKLYLDVTEAIKALEKKSSKKLSIQLVNVGTKPGNGIKFEGLSLVIKD